MYLIFGSVNYLNDRQDSIESNKNILYLYLN